jgi:hypothetical protein
MSAARRIAGSVAAESRGSLSFHETPPELTEALLAHQTLPRRIWEPACGAGAIARVLEQAGHGVIATDLADRGFGTSGINFLRTIWPSARAIVTNPPFDNRLGEAFAAHGLHLLAQLPCSASAPRFLCLLHRFRWIETEPRDPLFLHPAFRRVIVYARRRAPMLHRAGWQGKKLQKSTELYAWFVWELDNLRTDNFDRFEMVRA